MSITVAWDNPEKTILRQTYTGRWTWNQFYAASEQTRDLMDSVDHRVDILIDMRHSSTLPQNAMSHIGVVERRHRNQGRIVAVGVNQLIQLMFRIVLPIRPHLAEYILIVRTMDEAYAVLTGTADHA